MSRKNLSKLTLALLVFSGSCESEQVCSIDPERPSCHLEVSISALPAQSLMAKEADTQFQVQIAKRRDGQHESLYPVWFVEPGSGGQAVRVGEATYLKEADGGGGLFQVLVGKNNPRLKVRQRYAIRVGIPGSETVPEAAGESDPMVTTVKRTIRYQTPTVLAQKMQALANYPQLRLLGMVGNALVGVGSGADALMNPWQKLKGYSWTVRSLSPMQAGETGLFWETVFAPVVRLSASGNQVLLSIPMNETWVKCGLDAALLTECSVNKTLPVPMEMQQVASSGDGKWIGYVRGDGSVQVGEFGGSGWMTLGGPSLSGTVNKGLWFADVNGDGREDVVAAWQGSELEVKVYLALASGMAFAEDVRWSKAMGTVGSGAVSAMTVGDLDTDGYADVVVAKGLTIEAYQSVAGESGEVGKMVKVWSQELDKAQAGPEVQSLTIGRIGGGDASVSPDVMAATYSECTVSSKCDVYLYAFRAMN